MDADLQRAVEALIGRETGSPARVAGSRGASGGCIHDARTVELDDGRRFFVKANPRPLPRMFEAEAEGLAALADAGVLRVPRPLGTGEAGGTAFLVMEAIDVGSPGAGFFEVFGRRFAELHRGTTAERFGFEHDNYLGSTPQPNAWADDWVDFWRRRRLGHLLELARRAGLSDPELDRLGDRLMERLDEVLDLDEPPCLLHGDLWGGNYLADAAGEPVLIDPATYYGQREADLAMTRLFGGFTPAFYRAYEEAWPLAPGSPRRLAVYELYHLLNHLVLFGGGYRAGCVERLRRVV